MYSILLDENNYFTGSYAEIGSVKGGVEVESLPEDMTKAVCYRFESGVWVYDEEKWERLKRERLISDISEQRNVAFALIDRYQLALVYASLTDEQKTELATYRDGWLDAPETLIVPSRPSWML